MFQILSSLEQETHIMRYIDLLAKEAMEQEVSMQEIMQRNTVLQQQIQSLQKSNTHLEAVIQQKQDTIKLLEIKLTDYKEKKETTDQLQQRISALEREREQIIGELVTLRSQNISLKNELAQRQALNPKQCLNNNSSFQDKRWFEQEGYIPL